MKHKILIFGKGYISSRLQEGLGALSSGRRIYSFKDAEAEIKKFSPGVIINCIGHIGRNVDDCELDRDKTLMSNTFVPVILAEAALRNKIKFIHISSGCIYSYNYKTQGPIREDEPPDFFRLFYSRSKIYSERALAILSGKFNILIPRIRIPLDNRPHPRNILTKLINYRKAIDLPNSITYIPDFIKALKHLIRIDAKGIYNVVNKGGLMYPDLLDIYKRHAPGFNYRIIDYKKINLVRTNLILSTGKLEKAGFKVRDIKEVLEGCVRDYLRYS